MLITFQYPIVDFRSLHDNNYKLSVPCWPMPEDELMIRNFGLTQKRLNGGVTDWSGENKFCSSRKAIKIPNLECHKLQLGENFFIKSECAFRRLNSNGNFLVKLEVGFSNQIESFLHQKLIKEDSFEKLIYDYCNLEVHIKNPVGKEVISTISKCGKAISDLYLYSTSSSEGLKENKLDKIWVSHGESLCLIEYRDEENKLKIPKVAKLVDSYKSPGIVLYHYWAHLADGRNLKTWIIKCDSSYNINDLRNLRLNLLRINAEKETVRKLCYFLQNKGAGLVNSKEKADLVSNYLEFTSSKLLKDIRYGINQNNILDVALKAEETAQPGELESYMETLAPLKNKYVSSNIEQMIRKGITINIENNTAVKQKILFITSNPLETTQLRINKEVREIDECLQRSNKRENFDFEIKLATRPRDLSRAILDENPQILHFSGHGEKEGIILENDNGHSELVSTEAISGLFNVFKDTLECVFINSCYSESQAKEISKYIPFVIGMKRSVPDETAIAFAVSFYDAIGAGKDIEFAFKLAKSNLPVLGVSGKDLPVLHKKH